MLGCSKPTPTDSESIDQSNKLTKVKLQLNWFPEAEHGCFYAAQVNGFYEDEGLDVEIIPGGKSTVLAQELTLGRVEFAIGNAEDVLAAVQQDAPLMTVMTFMQHTPRCLLLRKESGITAFDQLNNVTLLLDSSQAFVAYLKSLGFINDSVKVAPYFGSIAPLATDVNYGCQGYSFSEPYLAKQEGIEVNILNVTDIGFDPYCSVLVVNRETASSNAELVKRFVAATQKGIAAYMQDPAKANALILKNNTQGMTADALDFGAKEVAKLCTVEEGTRLGAMSTERWKTLIEQLEKIEFITQGKIRPEDVFTNDFTSQ